MGTKKINQFDVDETVLTIDHENDRNPHGTTASDVGAVAQAPGENISILARALELGIGVHHFQLGATNYTGTDLPASNYRYSMATVYKRHAGIITVVLHGLGAELPVVHNYYNGTDWSGWSTEFIPLTGGTLSGNDLYIANGLRRLAGDGTGIQLDAFDTAKDYNNRSILKLFSPANKTLSNSLEFTRLVSGGGSTYQIFGEHNKPSGSYTGNGSATTRTINVGGIGNLLVIIGNGALTFVTNGGGWTLLGGTTPKMNWNIGYSNGVLTLSTDDIYVNDNGTGFFYYVL